MRNVSRLIRLVILFVLVSGVLAPFAAVSAQTPSATGDLQITLSSDNGSLLGGGCYTVVDAEGVAYPICDDDGDGIALLTGLAPGVAAITQTAAPDGYTGGATGTATIVAASTAVANLVNAALATETPTEIPTQELTETPTAVATEEATPPAISDEPLFETAADDRSVQIDCTYDPDSDTTDYEVHVTKLDSGAPDEDPQLTIVASPLANDLSVLPDQTYHLYESGSMFYDEPWRELTIEVTWPDGVSAQAQAACKTAENDTEVVTAAFDENDEPILNGGQVALGTAIRDTASLEGATINAGGTATYNLYFSADCSGDPVSTETVAVTDRTIPNSGLYEPTESGLYNWQVVYSGDELNAESTSVCGTERVIVGSVTPTLTTTMKNAAGDTTIPHGGTIPVDTTVYDTSVLAGASDTAGGTVTYSLYDSADCLGTPILESTVSVTNGVIEPSDTQLLDLPGTYNWVAEYSGDVANDPVTSGCGSETLEVTKLAPTASTIMQNAETEDVIGDGAVIPVETSVQDSVVLTGATADAGGSVTFRVYNTPDCTGTSLFESVVPVVNGAADFSDAYQFLTPGVYNWQAVYSGDDRNEVATSPCGSETLNVEKRSPSLATVMHNDADDSVIADEELVPLGTSLYDTAQLTGASSVPTGTITYNLYKGYNCTGTPLQTYGPLDLVGGVIPPSPAYEPAEHGTYNWQAVYSGDGLNNGATSPCGSEQFFIEMGTGGVSTRMERQGGQTIADDTDIEFGTSIRDFATLHGVTPDAGGTVTFSLYAGTECTGTPVFTQTVNVTNGTLPPTDFYGFPDMGTFNWHAVYSGDANNDPAGSPCGSETLLVGKKFTSVVTTMYRSDTEAVIADNAGILVGTTVYDTAVISGTTADAGGTITYDLFKNADCSGSPVFTSTKTVTNGVAPASDTYVIDEPTVYQWRVTYSGDGLNRTSVSACGTETINGQVQPTIATEIQGIEHGSTIDLDTVVVDTATLAGQSATAGGTATYNLYEGDCTGSPFYSSTRTVANGAIPDSAGYLAIHVGTFNWQVVYSGDTHNLPVTSECGSESFSVDGPLTITTTMRSGGQIIGDDATISVGTAINDQGNLHGTTRTAGGTVVYNLYPNEDCSGAPLFTDTKTVSGGVAPQSNNYTANLIGTFNWQVVYSGDAENAGIISECGTETFNVTGGVNRQIGITCQFFLSDSTSTFVVSIAKLNPSAPDTDPNLTVVATPLALDLSTLPSITYHDYNSGAMFTREPWRRIQVEVTWPDGVKGIASAGCNSQKLAPTLTTGMVTEAGDSIEQNGQVLPGTSVGDTATLTGATVTAKGTVTYQLFANDDCTGTPIYEVTRTVTNGVIPPTDFVEVTEGGLYNWVVTYSGDNWDQPATSACGSERFFVGENTIEIETLAEDASGSPLPDGSTVTVNSQVRDTVTLTGATETAGGTVTYNLYLGDCSGAPVFTETVPVVDGVAAPSSLAELDTVGSYEWQVVYSGDSENPPATSVCGDETVVTEKAEPSITTLLSAENISVGDEVNDTAELSGATSDAGGTVTYYVYTDAQECEGNPLYTFGPFEVVDGAVPDSPSQVFNTAGDYQWQAVYSGDAKNEPAISVCGSEPLTVQASTLSISKEADAASVSAGDQIGYTITVTNDGPGVARDVTLTDSLPTGAGLAWSIDTANSSDDCAIESGELTCDARDLAAAETIVVHIVSPTTAVSCGEITNVASTSSSNAEGAESEAVTITVLCPDVSIVKTADAASVSAGDEIGFTIAVTSDGPGTARDVTVVDTLPVFEGASWSIDDANTDETCAIAGGALSCDFGDLAAGETREVHIVSSTTADSCGLIENTASVSASNEPESSLGDNEDSDDVEVLCPNVTVTKVASSERVTSGDSISFEIVVTNTGDGIARDVTIGDPLLWGSNWQVDSEDCAVSGTDLSCDFGDLDTGESRTITLTGDTVPGTCGSFRNTVIVDATNEAAEDSDDNTAHEFITVDCPNLNVTKQAENGTITAGDIASFTIEVANAGSGIARNVTLEDTLPAGVEWAVDNTEDCEIAAGVLTCDFGELEPGASIAIVVSGAVDQNDCGVITNTVTVASTNEPEGVLEDNDSTDTVAVNCADLDFTKIPDQAQVSAGSDIGFTLTITNEGDGEARNNVILTDTLPTTAGLVWTIDAQSQEEACAIDSGVLSCDFGIIEPGETVSVHITSPTTAATCGVVSNQALIESSNTDDGNASGSVQVLCPNVTLEKSAENATISANDEIFFTLLVENIGLGTASDVVVTDQLPEGIAWQVTDPDCTIEAGLLTCSYEELAPDQQIEIVITGVAPPEVCGEIENRASVSVSNEAGSAGGDNSGSASVTVQCPDIEVTKRALETPVTSGDEGVFEIVVTNNGAGIARDVTLADTLPEGMEWQTSDNVPCELDDVRTLTCGFGDLASGASATIQVSALLDYEDCGDVSNTVTAAATNESGEELDNNESTAVITVRCADPNLTKVPDQGTVSAGTAIGFTLTLVNGGDGEARGVGLSDALPVADGLAWTIDEQSTEGACEIANGELTCDWGTVEAGGSRSVHITSPTTAATCGVVDNEAAFTSTNTPSTSATGSVTVLCPDVTIEKSAASDTVVANDEIVWTLTVSNIGEGDATGVVVEDQLPTGIAWQVTDADCAIESGVLTCEIADLAAGASRDIAVTGVATPDQCGVIENTGAVSAGNELDDATDNNSSTATVTVTCPNLVVEKTAVAETVPVGGEAAFSIVVRNDGDGAVRDVTLIDTLPAGIDWSVDNEDCEIVEGVLSCDLGDLEAGASITITVSGFVDLADCGDIVNTVSVSATNEPDDRLDDNESTAAIRVPCGEVDVEKIGNTLNGEDVPLAGACFELWQEGAPVFGIECTDEAGYLTFGKVPAGTYVLHEVTAPENYVPMEDSEPFAVPDGETVALSVRNTLAEGDVDLLKFFCITNGEAGTGFTVTTQRGAGSEVAGCEPGADISFTITGDKLDEPLPVTTDASGLASLDLIVGDYTITEDSTGASAEFSVELNATTVITVRNLYPAPSGVVEITKLWCELPDRQSTMEVGGSTNPDGCAPGDAIFQIDGGPAFHVGSDGFAGIELESGEHTFTEPCAGISTSFTVEPNGTTGIVVRNDPQGESCGNPPGKEPVKEMPNTGAGLVGDRYETSRMLLAIGLMAATLGTLLVARDRRRPTLRRN